MKNIINSPLIYLCFAALGLAALLLFCFQQWIGSLLLVSLFGIIVIIYLSYYHPVTVLFISLLMNYSIIKYKLLGFFILIILCLVSLVRRRSESKPIFHFDIVSFLWSVLLLLLIITIPRWNNLREGIKGSVEMVIMPFLLFKMINDKWIEEISIKTIATIFLPIFAVFILVQVAYAIVFSKELSNVGTSINIMAFHNLDIIWGKSNTVAAILTYLSLILFSAQQILIKNILHRLIVNIIIFVSLLSIIVILSKGAILSLVCGILIMMLLYMLIDKKIKILPWLFMGTFAYFIIYDYVHKIWLRFSTAIFESSTMSRITLWLESIYQIRNNILIGVGPKQFKFALDSRVCDPHNMFLRYGVDLGFISIIILTIILTLPVFKIFKLHRRKYYKINKLSMLFLPSYIAAIVNSQVEIVVQSYIYGMLFWLFYAIMWNKITIYEKEQKLIALDDIM